MQSGSEDHLYQWAESAGESYASYKPFLPLSSFCVRLLLFSFLSRSFFFSASSLVGFIMGFPYFLSCPSSISKGRIGQK